MRSVYASLVAGLVTTLISPAYAGLYVVRPLETGSCAAGKPCTLEWLDDGESPLLSNIGPCTVGLYHGELKKVQTIAPVDISATHTLTFTPHADAGPNGFYYVAFTSAGLRNSTDAAKPYMAFTPAFKLTGMTGSYSNPIASLTRTSSIPSSVAAPSDTSVVSTTTIGPPITDVPTLTPSVDFSPSTSTSESAPASSSATHAEASSTASSVRHSSASALPSKPPSNTAQASVSSTATAPASSSRVSGAPSGKPSTSGFATSISSSSSAPPVGSAPSGSALPDTASTAASSPLPTSNAAAFAAVPVQWTVLSLFFSMLFAL